MAVRHSPQGRREPMELASDGVAGLLLANLVFFATSLPSPGSSRVGWRMPFLVSILRRRQLLLRQSSSGPGVRAGTGVRYRGEHAPVDVLRTCKQGMLALGMRVAERGRSTSLDSLRVTYVAGRQDGTQNCGPGPGS